jgi:D-sedoheptulose 7-phosphate isomerase
MPNYEEVILAQIEATITLERYLQGKIDFLIDVADVLIKAFRRGNKVLLFGNGGSAADAQHIAAELSGKFYLERQALPALSLNTNISSLTAIANDFGYDNVFVRQLQGLLVKNDVAVGISTSGNSRNVIMAIEEAKRMGAITVALTNNFGKLKDLAHYSLCIPSCDTPRIQEAHITAGHIICFLVERELFGKEKEV